MSVASSWMRPVSRARCVEGSLATRDSTRVSWEEEEGGEVTAGVRYYSSTAIQTTNTATHCSLILNYHTVSDNTPTVLPGSDDTLTVLPGSGCSELPARERHSSQGAVDSLAGGASVGH